MCWWTAASAFVVHPTNTTYRDDADPQWKKHVRIGYGVRDSPCKCWEVSVLGTPLDFVSGTPLRCNVIGCLRPPAAGARSISTFFVLIMSEIKSCILNMSRMHVQSQAISDSCDLDALMGTHIG